MTYTKLAEEIERISKLLGCPSGHDWISTEERVGTEILPLIPEIIAALRERSQGWISVKERLPSGHWSDSIPDISEEVIVSTVGGVGAAAYHRAKAAHGATAAASNIMAHEQRTASRKPVDASGSVVAAPINADPQGDNEAYAYVRYVMEAKAAGAVPNPNHRPAVSAPLDARPVAAEACSELGI